MIRFLLPMLLLGAFASASACETTKLQREMLEDSAWETSEGDEEPYEPVEPKRKTDDEQERGYAPDPGAASEAHGALMAPRRTTGLIERDELYRVLDEGLGAYLQNVETEPAFDQGRFVGFRIIQLFPGDLTYASLDLRPGDVVTRINGMPISRPEHASAIWEELRTASELTVDYRRDDSEKLLKFTIVDAG